MARDLSPGLRRALARLIRSRSGVIRDGQRRAILATRSGATAAMILGTIVLWAPDLSDFVLSITAFVLAIVIATKEVLMGLAGGIVRSTPGAVTIGDRIEAGGHGGEVVEITGVVLPPPAPEVRIRTTGLAELRVEMRLFCPCERAGDKEQAATLARLGATRG